MSWSFQVVAKSKSSVKAELDKKAADQASLPPSVAEVIKSVVDQMPESTYFNGIIVESNGHIGGDYNNCTFTVKPINIGD